MSSAEPPEWRAYLTTGNDGKPMLRNKVGAYNAFDLAAHEYREVMARTREIRRGHVVIAQTGDLAQWQAIHAHQFGDVYEWAGRLRTANMSKDGVGFTGYDELESYLGEHIATAASLEWGGMDRDEFIPAAAWSFSALNAAHPFREGNGRSLRLFVDQLSAAAMWWIDYSRIGTPDGIQAWDAACHATRASLPDIDPTPLEALFNRIVEAKDPASNTDAQVMPDAPRQLLGMARIRPAARALDPASESAEAAMSHEHYRAVERDVGLDGS